jgi:hypothetical protein
MKEFFAENFLPDSRPRACDQKHQTFYFLFFEEKKRETRKNYFIVLKKNYKALSEGQSAVIETINWESIQST